jgi:hypothetical protein
MIDTRDLIEEAEALEIEEEDGTIDEDDRARLFAIRELADSGIEDWQYGATLIPESEFKDYAYQLAEDIGAIPADAAWPLTCIDWQQAADELRHDYTCVTFDGEDYLVR